MKKILVVFSAACLVAGASWAMAGEPSPKDSKEPKVACCHKGGKCDNNHSKAECEKSGVVVKDCKDCK